jgi:hypothetical protein
LHRSLRELIYHVAASYLAPDVQPCEEY